MRGLRTCALVALMASCAGAAHAQSEIADFRTIGEGLTSAEGSAGIVAAFRMFSVPTFSQSCGATPHRLVTPEAQLTLRVGQAFALEGLVITAVDAAGGFVPAVPIGLEAEATTPPVLLLTNDALADGRLFPIAPGTFALRARTLCPGTAASVIVKVSVVDE